MTLNKNKPTSVLRSSAKMAGATLTSRVLGLVREQVMAATFGASGMTDAYQIAFRIPNMLRDLLAEGAFSSAFVPILTERLGRSESEARKLVWAAFLSLLVVTGILTVLVFIFASPLVALVTDEVFASDRERFELTVTLLKMMAPFLVFVSLAALCMGTLNTLGLFFFPALAPASFNVAMIVAMISLPAVMIANGQHPILSMGIGVLAGGFLQLVVQLPLLFKKKFGPMAPDRGTKTDLNRIFKRLSIGTVGVAATQINVLINTFLATSTMLGAVSWLNYAFRLFQFPVGILGVSIANSNLVHFSKSVKAGDVEKAKKFLSQSLVLALLTIVPCMALLMAMAEPTVRLIFEHGAFDASDTAKTALALKCYALGLPFYGLYKIFSPSFFALDRPKTPVKISVFCIILNIIFCLSFIDWGGFKVLALGTSLSMGINVVLQIFALRKLLKLGPEFFFKKLHALIFVAGAICFAATWFLTQGFLAPGGESFISFLIKFIVVGSSGALSYVLALRLFGHSVISLFRSLR